MGQFNHTRDARQWAEQQFGQAALGDRRRNRRAVELAMAMLREPAASLPKQTQSWGALKSAYRLLNRPEVTHQRLSQPHWQQTRDQALLVDGRSEGHRVHSGDPVHRSSNVVLFVQDTSQIDFTSHVATSDLGYIGDSKGYGIMMHTCLAIVPADRSGGRSIRRPIGRSARSRIIGSSIDIRSRYSGHSRPAGVAPRTVDSAWRDTERAPGSLAGVGVVVGDAGEDRPSTAERSIVGERGGSCK